eukprot:6483384-Pyramimonas_sp.AAC.1
MRSWLVVGGGGETAARRGRESCCEGTVPEARSVRVTHQPEEKHAFAPGMAARLIGLKATPLLDERGCAVIFYGEAADR